MSLLGRDSNHFNAGSKKATRTKDFYISTVVGIDSDADICVLFLIIDNIQNLREIECTHSFNIP